jgi:hypothetical protein
MRNSKLDKLRHFTSYSSFWSNRSGGELQAANVF